MKIWPVALAVGAAQVANAAAPTMAEMRDHRRVLVIAAPVSHDARAVEQRRIVGGWSKGAADRDISVVELSGERVTGTGDDAGSLRKRLALKPGVFQVVLIGKDGHVALRSAQPVTADRLQRTIDAMPMRQAGER
jgi:hypothetical protein